jgi:predicted protein tyrosine phosphatase
MPASWTIFLAAEDAAGCKRLAGYMLRAPMPLQKRTYDAATGTVIYRSKMHAGLKRNFQVMPGAERLALLCKHIPDRYEHLVRYVGQRGAVPCALTSLRNRRPRTAKGRA